MTRHQIDMDALALCLNDPEVMGPKNTMGAERIARLLEAVHKQSEELVSIANNDPERDYLVARLDRKLKEIMGDQFAPFEVRYEGLVKPLKKI